MNIIDLRANKTRCSAVVGDHAEQSVTSSPLGSVVEGEHQSIVVAECCERDERRALEAASEAVDVVPEGNYERIFLTAGEKKLIEDVCFIDF